MWTYSKKWAALVLLFIQGIASANALSKSSETHQQILTMEQAIQIAIKQDPWLSRSLLQQQAIEAKAIAARTLPNPMVSLGLANIAADSFNFDQEPMTQLKIGVAQQFPRGNSLSLAEKRLQILSNQHPFQRKDREAKVTTSVGQLWLEAYRANQVIQLIEKDRQLFEHLVDVAESNYSSALGRSRQQDLVRAQLEITRLEDRLLVLKEHKETSLNKLYKWLISDFANADELNNSLSQIDASLNFSLPDAPPKVSLVDTNLLDTKTGFSREAWLRKLAVHPAILALDRKIEASQVAVSFAEQKYQPQWGINASYGYRDDRADLVSVGVSFDLPFFTSERQDKELQSAKSTAASLVKDKWLSLRNMAEAFDISRTQLIRLNQRHEIYQKRLLSQMHEQAEAALTAYTNDDGDFAEVVRARIAELNARIDSFNINVNRLKTILQLNYFLSPIQNTSGEST